MEAGELSKWQDIEPRMMSEEETVDAQTLKRKRPLWRSSELIAFLDALDERSVQAEGRNARKRSILGSPIPNSPPKTANKALDDRRGSTTAKLLVCRL